MKDDDESKLDVFRAPTASTTPPDRASESVVSTDYRHGSQAPPMKQTPAISSGPFEIHAMAPTSDPPPMPAVQIEQAMGRSRGSMPLSRVVTIGGSLFALLVLVIIALLFR